MRLKGPVHPAKEFEFILKALGRQKKFHIRVETQLDLVFRNVTRAPRWPIEFMSNASSK